MKLKINVREYQSGNKKKQSRETRQTQNTIHIGHHYMQTHTNNVNKTSYK